VRLMLGRSDIRPRKRHSHTSTRTLRSQQFLNLSVKIAIVMSSLWSQMMSWHFVGIGRDVVASSQSQALKALHRLYLQGYNSSTTMLQLTTDISCQIGIPVQRVHSKL
jgi:hypothetical protein